MESKEEKKQQILFIIWVNLFIGLYNIYVFSEMSSIFHLVIGVLNVGVWVFFRKESVRMAFLEFRNR
jgi:hypothetical protein